MGSCEEEAEGRIRGNGVAEVDPSGRFERAEVATYNPAHATMRAPTARPQHYALLTNA